MAKKNERIMIISNVDKSFRNRARNNYIGHTGVVIGNHGTNYYMLMQFDDKKLEEENHWLWCDDEVMVLDLDNQEFVR